MFLTFVNKILIEKKFLLHVAPLFVMTDCYCFEIYFLVQMNLLKSKIFNIWVIVIYYQVVEWTSLVSLACIQHSGEVGDIYKQTVWIWRRDNNADQWDFVATILQLSFAVSTETLGLELRVPSCNIFFWLRLKTTSLTKQFITATCRLWKRWSN